MKVDRKELREAALAVIASLEEAENQRDPDGVRADYSAYFRYHRAARPQMILALLDELEEAEKRP